MTVHVAHETEIRQLLTHLGHLASQWRSTDDPQVEGQIEAEYETAVEQLCSLGWDGNIQIDSLLPLERMPEAYMRRYPDEANPTVW